jgi:hypothetical protein
MNNTKTANSTHHTVVRTLKEKPTAGAWRGRGRHPGRAWAPWEYVDSQAYKEEEEEEEEEEEAQSVTQSACSTMCTGTQVHCKEDSAATIANTTVILSPEVSPHGSRRLESRGGAISAQIERMKWAICLVRLTGLSARLLAGLRVGLLAGWRAGLK